MAGRQGGDARAVVTVFVGDQHRVEVAGLQAQPGQAPLGLAYGKAAVHQQSSAAGFHQGGIAAAAAAQRAKTHQDIRRSRANAAIS